MPVYKHLSSINSLSQLKSFIFDVIESAGYVVVTDRSFEENYKVYRLPAVDGYDYLRVHCMQSEGHYTLYFTLYYFWNPLTRTGIAGVERARALQAPLFAIATSSFIHISDSNGYLGIYKLSPFYNPVYTITENVSPGSNKTIPLNSVEGIVPNSYWVVSTRSGSGRAVVKISSVDSASNSVVVGNLPISLTSGNKMLKFVGSYVVSNANPPLYGAHSLYSYEDSSLNLSPTASWFFERYYSFDGVYSYGFVDFTLLYPVIVRLTRIPFKVADGSYYEIPFSRSVTAPSITPRSVLPLDIISTGTVSSAGSTSLTDNTKNWEANSLVGKYVVIQSSKDCRKIISNTSNTITVESDWFAVPTPETLYFICSEALFVDNRVSIAYYEFFDFYPAISLSKD